MQGFTAFKLNVELSHEFNDKLARAAGKFKNQLVSSAYETWKQYAQHNKVLQSRLATAVGALRNRGLRSAFCGWREAALVSKGHKQKVKPKTQLVPMTSKWLGNSTHAAGNCKTHHTLNCTISAYAALVSSQSHME